MYIYIYILLTDPRPPTNIFRMSSLHAYPKIYTSGLFQ